MGRFGEHLSGIRNKTAMGMCYFRLQGFNKPRQEKGHWATLPLAPRKAVTSETVVL